MDLENFDTLVAEYPEAERKTMLLGLFDAERKGQDIPDPYDLDESGAGAVLLQIQRAASGLAFWLGEEATAASVPSVSAHDTHSRVVPSRHRPAEGQRRDRQRGGWLE
jgi:hypothetical protein